MPKQVKEDEKFKFFFFKKNDRCNLNPELFRFVEFRRGLSIAIASFGKEHPKVAQFETNITHW